MKKSKLFLFVILLILLVSCTPAINLNVSFDSVDIDINNDGKRDYWYEIIHYNDIKYIEPKFSDEYYREITDEDLILYQRVNFPMAGTTFVYSKNIANPDYLLVTFGGDYLRNIVFREDININDQIFIYQDIEIKLYNHFILVDNELKKILSSLSSEETELVIVGRGKETFTLTMKNYPEISYELSLFRYYDGIYYISHLGEYYKISDDLIELLKNNNFLKE